MQEGKPSRQKTLRWLPATNPFFDTASPQAKHISESIYPAVQIITYAWAAVPDPQKLPPRRWLDFTRIARDHRDHIHWRVCPDVLAVSDPDLRGDHLVLLHRICGRKPLLSPPLTSGQGA